MDYQQEFNKLLEIVIKEGASDLHLSEARHPTLRVSGELLPLVSKPQLTDKDTFGFMSVLLDKENQEKFLRHKEIDFSYAYKDELRFRCNCFVQKGAIGIAMRVIPTKIRSLEELNLPSSLAEFALQKQGFFLVVGPVGHGKTTTLAALIELINNERSSHIITIEDPIEYLFEQKKSIIDQREIGRDASSFATALHGVFRQDVNVVLVGEMRDTPTMSTAVTAAETGHLIFSTLHTNSASQTIDRIIDAFPPEAQNQIRTQLASSLSGILSQRLVPSTNGGRVPAYELLVHNDAVANLIRENRVHEIDSVIQTSSEQGMVDMNRSLADLVRSGQITIDTAHRYSPRPQLLDKFV
jgi:twitching motility protein PilT